MSRRCRGPNLDHGRIRCACPRGRCGPARPGVGRRPGSGVEAGDCDRRVAALPRDRRPAPVAAAHDLRLPGDRACSHRPRGVPRLEPPRARRPPGAPLRALGRDGGPAAQRARRHPHARARLGAARGRRALLRARLGRVLQLVHVRAWRLELPKKRSDQGRYALVLLGLCGLLLLLLVQAKELTGGPSWDNLAVAPGRVALLTVFFIWAPRLLTYGQLSWRDLFRARCHGGGAGRGDDLVERRARVLAQLLRQGLRRLRRRDGALLLDRLRVVARRLRGEPSPALAVRRRAQADYAQGSPSKDGRPGLPARDTAVRLLRHRRRLLDARAVPERELVPRVDDLVLRVLAPVMKIAHGPSPAPTNECSVQGGQCTKSHAFRCPPRPRSGAGTRPRGRGSLLVHLAVVAAARLARLEHADREAELRPRRRSSLSKTQASPSTRLVTQPRRGR